jgi:hypothetical protein
MLVNNYISCNCNFFLGGGGGNKQLFLQAKKSLKNIQLFSKIIWLLKKIYIDLNY